MKISFHLSSYSGAFSLFLSVTLFFSTLLFGCGDESGIQPGALRFGQIGEVRVTLVVPLLFNDQRGELQQVLTWNSTGAWQLREAISYRNIAGDETLSRNTEDAGRNAARYATLITELNDTDGLKLFPEGEVPQVLIPECSIGETRISFLIRDDIKNQTATWNRCTEGSLGTLVTSSSGPDAAAVRVVQAAILVRDRTHQDPQFASAYLGSVPYGTLDRGEDSGAGLVEPRAFFSSQPGLLDTPEGWVSFWRAHTDDPTAQPPAVDWAHEMVLVAADGKRTEAGDSLEIRRILQTGDGTQVWLFERIPGNFCSPASRDHFPVHIVVTPRTLLPIQFLEFTEERVHCGF